MALKVNKLIATDAREFWRFFTGEYSREYVAKTWPLRAYVVYLIRSGGRPTAEQIAAALADVPHAASIARVPLTDAERLALMERGEMPKISEARRKPAMERARKQIEEESKLLREYRPPRRRPRGTTATTVVEHHQIVCAYFITREMERRKGRRRTGRAIKAEIAKRYGVSVRTLERHVRGLTPVFEDDPA